MYLDYVRVFWMGNIFVFDVLCHQIYSWRAGEKNKNHMKHPVAQDVEKAER